MTYEDCDYTVMPKVNLPLAPITCYHFYSTQPLHGHHMPCTLMGQAVNQPPMVNFHIFLIRCRSQRHSL